MIFLDTISTQLFYGWWQLSVCLFAFLGLLSIWYHIGRKQKDFGQVWLGLSILCWSLSGGLEVLSASNELPLEDTKRQLILEGGRSILSLLNSLFILLALPWFHYLPSFLHPWIKSRHWNLIVILPFLFSLFPTISKMVSGHSPHMISELDVYYSVLTLAMLGVVLWESFQKRRLIGLAYLSVVCIMITFVAQLYKLTDDQQANQILLAAIFKSTLIMIFFALALSWVKELSEKLQVAPEQIFLKLTKHKDEKNKLLHQVEIKGVLNNAFTKVNLSPAQYQLLSVFVIKKLSGENWLKVKPKSETRSSKQYDIKDYNEIKRLLAALLDGLYGKEMWSKAQHEVPLKAALFDRSENREGKIMLRIPAENMQGH